MPPLSLEVPVTPTALAVVLRAPPSASIELRAGSIAQPPLVQREECTADLAFCPQSAEGAPRTPKFKITTTLRGRPTGGG